MNEEKVRAALRKLASAVGDLAEAFGENSPDPWAQDKAMIREWGERGLTASEASALCARHGFPGQKVSAWCRGYWAEVRTDGRRYLTQRTWDWMRDQGEPDADEKPRVITDDCLKCGESFDAVLEPDGNGGETAMTVCPSCFEHAVGSR